MRITSENLRKVSKKVFHKQLEGAIAHKNTHGFLDDSTGILNKKIFPMHFITKLSPKKRVFN